MPQQNVSFLVTVLVLFGVVIFLAKLFKKSVTFPYVRGRPLLTKPEGVLWRTLQVIVQDPAYPFLVLAKIRVADIIEPKKGLEGKARMSALGRIAQKHVDFVLIHPETYQVILAIELDDASHAKPERQKRDEFLNQAFAVANVPLLRYPTKAGLQNVALLRENIDQILNPTPAARSGERASARPQRSGPAVSGNAG